MAQLPPDQQPAFIAQHKGSLLKQLNFQPTQLQLLRNNHIQLQLSSHRPQVRTLPVQGQNQQQPNVIIMKWIKIAENECLSFYIFIWPLFSNSASVSANNQLIMPSPSNIIEF